MSILSNEQKTFWENNSYLCLPGLFSDISHKMSDWVEEVSKCVGDKRLIVSYEADQPNQISRIENFTHINDNLKEVIVGERSTAIISELMGEQAILYKERINFKLPGGGAHSAHQDGVAYEKGGDRKFDLSVTPYISILVAVDDASETNGCLEVVPEWSMTKDTILEMEYPDPSNPAFSKISQSVEDELHWLKILTKPGDAILFTERLPHRSEPNRSDVSRRVLYGVYNPEKEGDKREEYYKLKKKNINDPRYMVGNPHAREYDK